MTCDIPFGASKGDPILTIRIPKRIRTIEALNSHFNRKYGFWISTIDKDQTDIEDEGDLFYNYDLRSHFGHVMSFGFGECELVVFPRSAKEELEHLRKDKISERTYLE